MELITQPMEIEKRSFEMITEMLGDKKIDPRYADVVKRVIHTSADFDYADNLVFSPTAAESMLEALKGGADIVTDTQMAFAGINKEGLRKLGGNAHCFMSEPEVAAEAKKRGVTRASVAMEYAAGHLPKPLIFAVGNAPTALLTLKDLVWSGKLSPKLIIGVPVGFVNVLESKEEILRLPVPHIVAKGRKGGSNVAAAIVNAFIFKLVERD